MNITWTPGILLLNLLLIQAGHAWSQPDPISGKYQMTSDQAILTLELKVNAASTVSGTLSSNTGIQYSLRGTAAESGASGTCSDGTSSVFFELYVEADDLVFSLIEPDGWNNPDYNTATYLSFKRQQASSFTENKTPMTTNSEQPKPAGEGVGNPSWGFQFIPPAGWTYQQSGDAFMMGHHTIPGLILIFPHMLQSIPEMRQEMLNGIQEGANYLVPTGTISTLNDRILMSDYQGMMDGQQAKGMGYGTLSPYSGGAFILAVSTPEMLGDDIIKDAQWIATNLIYKKLETSELVSHFAGRWASFTTNTSTWIQFHPDGTYDEQYESSYSGDLSGGGNWNAYGGENAKGRWTVQGTRDQGRILVRLANGNEIYYDYRVHEENGQRYYGEYWFNGKLYSKGD